MDPSLRARQICAPAEPSMSDDLQHFQYETFKAHWRDRTIGHFSLNPDGSISNARLAAVSPLADFSFDYDWGRPVPFRIRAQFRFISDQPLQRTSAYRQARDRAVPEPRGVRPSASQSFVLRCKSD
jgi:hypothetical protein